MSPPEGTFRMQRDDRKELYYWPIPPFDLQKEKSNSWLKWTEIEFRDGTSAKMLTTKDEEMDIKNKNIDWSVGNYTNTVIWNKKVQNEKEKRIKKRKKEMEMETKEIEKFVRNELEKEYEEKEKERERIRKEKEDALPQRNRWQENGGNGGNGGFQQRIIKDLKYDLDKSIRDLNRELEEKLTMNFRREMMDHNNRENVVGKIQELLKSHQQQQPRQEAYGRGPMNPFLQQYS